MLDHTFTATPIEFKGHFQRPLPPRAMLQHARAPDAMQERYMLGPQTVYARDQVQATPWMQQQQQQQQQFQTQQARQHQLPQPSQPRQAMPIPPQVPPAFPQAWQPQQQHPVQGYQAQQLHPYACQAQQPQVQVRDEYYARPGQAPIRLPALDPNPDPAYFARVCSKGRHDGRSHDGFWHNRRRVISLVLSLCISFTPRRRGHGHGPAA